MKRIFCIFMALIFLSGCALSTIKPPKKGTRRPVERSVFERKAPKPTPRTVVIEEKEEILPLEKEEIK